MVYKEIFAIVSQGKFNTFYQGVFAPVYEGILGVVYDWIFGIECRSMLCMVWSGLDDLCAN